MAFQSIGSRVQNLPTVLAGPIVRRVQTKSPPAASSPLDPEPGGVSIWLVMKEYRTVGLQVFASDGVTQVGSLAQATPIQVGDHIFVVLITLNHEFNYGQRYYYNLIFGQPGNTTLVHTGMMHDSLFDQGILSSEPILADRKELLCYPGNNLPFFHTPRYSSTNSSGELEKVSIAHASCRKPHGSHHSPEVDALEHLDDLIIGAETTSPWEEVPQQLFLTGDQIYADDVDASLMYLIQDAIPVLYSSTYDPRARFFNQIPAEGFELSKRQKTVVEHGGFTSEGHYGQDHLIHESEYFLMYLFAWSDVLWPSQVPKFNWAVTGLGLDLDDYYKVYRKEMDMFPKAAQRYSRDPTMYVGTNDWAYSLKKPFESNSNHVETFRKSLVKVRRVLANVSTYMMFDDHDVTDDWFLNLGQARRVLGQPSILNDGKEFGRYIVTNGLMAYTLFQGWGNRPDYFKSGTFGRDLLLNIEEWYSQVVAAGATGTLKTLRKDITDRILPEIVPDTNSTFPNSDGFRLSSGIDWHYSMDCGSYNVIVIDTRTKRGFENNRKSPAALISSESLKEQIPHPQYQSNHSLNPTILVSPAPVLGCNSVEDIQKEQRAFQGEAVADFEAWGFNTTAWDAFIYSLMQTEMLVILSGDVHYGFCIQARVWDFSQGWNHVHLPNFPTDYRSTGTPAIPKNPPSGLSHLTRSLSMVQFVASSAKNSAAFPGTKSAHLTPLINGGNHRDLITLDERNQFLKMTYNSFSGRKEYPASQMDSVIHGKVGAFRNTTSDPELSHFPARQISLGTLVDPGRSDRFKTIVGMNNIGLINFFYHQAKLYTRQRLFFSVDSGKTITQTTHTALFDESKDLPYNGHV